jgi:sugar O-acyltransferase (sialic acid O-acetyltransferase NeuD family)
VRPLVLYGAGGLGREAALLVRAINERAPTWSLLGFADDGAAAGLPGLEVLGGFDRLEALAVEYPGLAVSISIGAIAALEEISARIDELDAGIELVNLAHPDASVSWDAVDLGRGNIIAAGARLANVRLGSFNVVNMNTVLGHDVVAGDFNLIHPGAVINGQVEIGSRVTIGAGAAIVPRISIGDGATVAIGAVVGRSVDPGDVVAGNPARVVARSGAR